MPENDVAALRYVLFPLSPKRCACSPLWLRHKNRFVWVWRALWFNGQDGSEFLRRNIWVWWPQKRVEIFSADLKNIHRCESFGSLVNNEVYRSCVEAEVLLHTWCKLNKWRYKNTRHVQTSAGDGLDESPDTWRPPLLRYIDIKKTLILNIWNCFGLRCCSAQTLSSALSVSYLSFNTNIKC